MAHNNIQVCTWRTHPPHTQGVAGDTLSVTECVLSWLCLHASVCCTCRSVLSGRTLTLPPPSLLRGPQYSEKYYDGECGLGVRALLLLLALMS